MRYNTPRFIEAEKTREVCGARVEFQSQDTTKLVDGEISSGQGSLVCRYPDGACQLANKQNTGFITRVVRDDCLVKDSS